MPGSGNKSFSGHSLKISALILVLLVLILTDLKSGSGNYSVKQILSVLFSENDGSSLWLNINQFRIPRIITAFVAGIALSVSGLQMQTLFRNPLAGPYILGISSGAGLGVALVVLGLPGLFAYSVFSTANNLVLIVAAWLGSAIVMMIIMTVSFRIKSIMTILVLGIMLGSGISAIISILQYFSKEAALKAFVVWTMGSLSGVNPEQIPFLIFGFIAGLLIAIGIVKPSNLILLGEDYAKTMGVNIRTYRTWVLLSTVLLTGTVTAFCGPIAFIGIAVPHISRMLSKTTRNGILLIYSALIGASVLILSDIFSQLPGSDLILPINAITSIIGIPVVVWIVFRKKN
ncbi:MAG: iron ABC transporter permease [Bacteroidales bacterium]|nr:iron ABC transporter permease [Bacteroidales bacterium]MCF8389516.1 iron ABC transporter permease [Bacteroidales bacterium]